MSKGFNVIELVMVIVLVGIIAVMVIPRIIATGTISARESAEMVAADIRKTRELALADTISRSITFTSGINSYTIDQGTANAQTVSPPNGVTINTPTAITFSRLGAPIANPTFAVKVGGTIVMVTQSTGRVTIS
jgi:prepilin-type N-terminal cleavage/methylation domain-containing protein